MFYTYAHTKPDGTIFYIGKGQKRRVSDKSNRNRHWNFIVKKHGFEAVVLAEFENEQDALDEEVKLIAHFRKFGTLVNITDGGDINPMYNPEVAARTAATKRAKGQYTGKEMREYNEGYQERMKDPEFAKQISIKRKKAKAASTAALHEKMRDVILQIRKLRSEGMKLKELKEMFDMTESSISNICNRKTYAEIS